MYDELDQTAFGPKCQCLSIYWRYQHGDTGTQGELSETDEVQTSLRWRDRLEPPRLEELGNRAGLMRQMIDRCAAVKAVQRVESEGEVKPTHKQRGGQRSTKKQQGREEQKKTEQISNNMTVTMTTWSLSWSVTDCTHRPIKLVRTHTDQCQSPLYSTPPTTYDDDDVILLPPTWLYAQSATVYCWQICVWTSFLLSWIWTHFRWNSSIPSKVGGQGLLNTWWGKPHIFGVVDFFPSLRRKSWFGNHLALHSPSISDLCMEI